LGRPDVRAAKPDKLKTTLRQIVEFSTKELYHYVFFTGEMRRACKKGNSMPSFDFSSEVDRVALKNAIDVANRQIDARYDFKGTSAKIEFDEKDKTVTLTGDSDFQLGQIKDILFPAMEKKEKESVKRLDSKPVQKISGNKVKQEMRVRSGIDAELAKKIVKMIKDSKLKLQSSIQGDVVRVSGAKRDDLQACIALITQSIMDYPIKFGNFRD
jgi:uncharacterized protein YajQ (UPF0234 family)